MNMFNFAFGIVLVAGIVFLATTIIDFFNSLSIRHEINKLKNNLK